MRSGCESLFHHADEGQKGVWERGAMKGIKTRRVGDGKHGAREKRQVPDPRESGPSLGRMLFLSCLDHNCLSHLFLST